MSNIDSRDLAEITHSTAKIHPFRRDETYICHHAHMGTRQLLVGCDFTYDAAVPTPAIFQVQPGQSRAFTVASEAWTTTPTMTLRNYSDLYGNRCARLVLPAGRSTFQYSAHVEVPD